MLDRRVIDEAEQRRFFDAVRGCADEAETRRPPVRHLLDVAGVRVALAFSSPALEAALLPAIAHLAIAGEQADATIRLFDSVGSGVAMVPPPSHPHALSYRGDIDGFDSPVLRAAFHYGESSLNLFDRESGTGLYWVNDPAALPYWSKASPLRTLFHWILAEHSAQLVHAACVGHAGGGLLITGGGGVGKSTTALACLEQGLAYAGDDYVALRLDPPRAYSLYNTAKLLPEQAARFPALAALIASDQRDDKVVVQLVPARAGQIARELPLKAIATPCFAAGEPTSFAPADPVALQRATAFTTLAQLPHAGSGMHAFVAQLLEDLPAFALRLGEDLDAIPAAIAGLLDKGDPQLAAVAAPAEAMRRRPLLSVIIPVYNGSRFLGQAVASVLRQRYQPIEIIVVDDGSTEDLLPAIEALPVDVRFVRQLNRGPAAARNRGLDEASGDLIAFLDVDDLWPPDTLETLAGLLALKPEAEAVQGRGQLVAADEAGVVTAELGNPEDSFPHYIGAALFRRSAFERVGRFDAGMRFGEDSDWFVRARQHDVKVARADRTTLLVRRHGGNMTEGKSLVELNMLAIIKKAIDRKRAMQGDRVISGQVE
jgi:hypothetical protein